MDSLTLQLLIYTLTRFKGYKQTSFFFNAAKVVKPLQLLIYTLNRFKGYKQV